MEVVKLQKMALSDLRSLSKRGRGNGGMLESLEASGARGGGDGKITSQYLTALVHKLKNEWYSSNYVDLITKLHEISLLMCI